MKPTRHLSRRKGSGKKGSARARNSKKLRGGVTRRRLSQLTQQELFTALQLLPADVVKQIGKRHPLLIPPFTNATLRRAVQDYLAGGARKEDIVKKYGEINNWDVSKVTDMKEMFSFPLNGAHTFNQPLNNWNVSNVMDMSRMFEGAESFKGPCGMEHTIHIRHFGHVPIVERLVEGGCVLKHSIHICHFGHVPIANLAVFVHNAPLPSSAGKIILNGATQSVVGKGRDEQRVPFSNLLDDIGGQEPQSSEEFLLCQLQQPFSGDATAQLFGVTSTRRALLS